MESMIHVGAKPESVTALGEAIRTILVVEGISEALKIHAINSLRAGVGVKNTSIHSCHFEGHAGESVVKAEVLP